VPYVVAFALSGQETIKDDRLKNFLKEIKPLIDDCNNLKN
jgi:hypothetical protein